MKANELMIGDWLQLKEEYTNSFPKYHKVDVLDTHRAIQMFDAIFEERFEPIPLTEEILKENGFKKRENDNVFICYEHKWVNIILTFTSHEDTHIDGYSLSFGTGGITLCYVHELQHALRLCGLTELADNFKIE